ncbi:MAG: DUF4383 domain-containing protein [Pseudonocardiales bacterium]
MIEWKGIEEMVMDPEKRFGIRVGGYGAKTPEQKFGLLFGAIYVGIGVVGFAFTGFDNLVLVSDDKLLGIFLLNPFHNIVHILVGGVVLLGALALSPSGTEGVNIGVGGFYLLAAVLGYLGYLDLVNVRHHADPDNFLHLFSGLAILLFGGGLLRAMQGERAKV